MHKNQKLSYEDKMHIAKDIVVPGLATKYVAKLYDISVRWAQIIAKEYRETGKVMLPKRRGGSKYRKYTEQLDSLILMLHKWYCVGAVLIGKILRERYKIGIDNNHIHEVLREEPWVCYERTHSLSAVHMEWYYDEQSGLWVCPVLDDASRKVLSMIETESPQLKPRSRCWTKHIRNICTFVQYDLSSLTTVASSMLTRERKRVTLTTDLKSIAESIT